MYDDGRSQSRIVEAVITRKGDVLDLVLPAFLNAVDDVHPIGRLLHLRRDLHIEIAFRLEVIGQVLATLG